MSPIHQQELAALKPGESVYKLMGAVLVRQDASDARALVNGRLEFLDKELARLEASINVAQERAVAARRTVIELQQTQAQAQQARR